MNNKGFTLVELMIVVAVLIIPMLLWPLTIWTGHNVDWVLSQWKHHAVHVSYWLDFILVIIGNGFTIAFDVIVEILKRVQ
jgi:hypothetical protein